MTTARRIPRLKYTWAAEITIGGYVIRTSRAATPFGSIGVWALDGLTLGWTVKDKDVWPSQLAPSTLSMSLYTTKHRDLPAMDIGTPFRFKLTVEQVGGAFDLNNAVVVAFAGKISDATGTPSRAGVRFDLVAVDPLADLAEIYVGDVPWPQENTTDRLSRIALAAGIDMAVAQPPYVTFAGKDVDRQTAQQVIYDVLAQLVGPSGIFEQGWTHPIMIPFTAEDTGAVRYAFGKVGSRGAGNSLELVRVNGRVTLQVTPARYSFISSSPGAVSADAVLPSLKFVKDKGKATQRVTVSAEAPWQIAADGTSVVTAQFSGVGGKPITENHDVDLVNRLDAQALAGMYLGEEMEAAQKWSVDAFTVVGSALPSIGFLAQVMPSTLVPSLDNADGGVDESYDGVGQLVASHPVGRVFTIYDVPAEQNLTDKGWILGSLTAGQLVISGGDITLTGNLRPIIPRPSNADFFNPAITSDGVKNSADFATTTYAQVDDSITYYDLRVVWQPAGKA